MKAVLLAIVFLFGLPSYADQGGNQRVASTFNFENELKLAKEGKPLSQYNVAYAYYYGRDTAQNRMEAFRWFKQVEDTDVASIRYRFGRLYQTGTIFNKDLKKAFEHYKFAADKGDPYGETNLSMMYLQGEGVKQNIQLGIEIGERVAKRGFVKAQFNLAMVYESDYFGVKNIEKAIYWYKQAILQESVEAHSGLGLIYLAEKRYKDAKESFESGSLLNDARSFLYLAKMYGQGLGVSKDMDKSIELLSKASELGSVRASDMLKKLKQK